MQQDISRPQTRTLCVVRMCVGLMDMPQARLTRGMLPLGSRAVLCIGMAVFAVCVPATARE